MKTVNTNTMTLNWKMKKMSEYLEHVVGEDWVDYFNVQEYDYLVVEEYEYED